MDAEQTQRYLELQEKLDRHDYEFLDCGSAANLRDLISDLLAGQTQAAYEDGFSDGHEQGYQYGTAEKRERDWLDGVQFGARQIQDAWKASAAQALLEAMGKDRGDGEINLGSAGTHYASERS